MAVDLRHNVIDTCNDINCGELQNNSKIIIRRAKLGLHQRCEENTLRMHCELFSFHYVSEI